MNSTLSKLLGNSLKTISNWKKEKRPIINLLLKYFSKEDLQEFIEFGKINKFENNNSIQEYFIETNKNKYIQSFNFSYLKSIDIRERYFILDFYFYFLSNFFNESNFDKALSEYRFKSEKIKFKRDNIKVNISNIKDLQKDENHHYSENIVVFVSHDEY